MTWDIRVDAQQNQMWLAGELTIFSVQDIRNRLLEIFMALDEVNIDLSEVTEVDTAGLQFLLLAKRKPGKRVRFARHSDEVLRMLDLANLGLMLGDPLVLRPR